jgi:hypothetical protein
VAAAFTDWRRRTETRFDTVSACAPIRQRSNAPAATTCAARSSGRHGQDLRRGTSGGHERRGRARSPGVIVEDRRRSDLCYGFAERGSCP